MGSSEMDKPAKDTRDSTKESKAPNSQEHTTGTAATTAATTVNPDWTGFQAYSPMPPPGYMASSPQAHPYMWGVQQFMPPPYGTPSPHPYVAMYPYAHPGTYPFGPYAMPSPNGVAEASGNTHGSTEVDGKSPEGKEKLPIKRSKGSLGSLNMITGKNNGSGKAGEAGNGVYPKSAESGSDSSSDGSDAHSENGSQTKSRSRQDLTEGEASQNGHTGPGGGPNALLNQTMAVMPGPTTNLNMGGVVAVGPRENMQPQLWLQDERELKKQRRKQSNRESARRSRLRKQAECDELAQRAEALNEENATLRAELSRFRSEYDQLLARNASLKERLGEASGQEEVTSVRNETGQ